MKTAVLLIAHGSREPAANADLVWLAGELLGRGGYETVVASYLELADPSIDEGGRQCVERGAQRVVMLPYFLSAGVHVQRDLHDHQRRLQKAYPAVEFLLAEPLGRHPLLIEVVASNTRDALRENPV